MSGFVDRDVNAEQTWAPFLSKTAEMFPIKCVLSIVNGMVPIFIQMEISVLIAAQIHINLSIV